MDEIKHKRRRNGGFTLTEVVVAAFILATGFTGFGIGFMQAMRTNRLAKHHYQAMCLARNRLQRARSISFSSIPLMEEDFQFIDQEGNLDPQGRFRRTTQVILLGDSLYDVMVEVYYPDSRNQPVVEVPVMMRTLVAEIMAE